MDSGKKSLNRREFLSKAAMGAAALSLPGCASLVGNLGGSDRSKDPRPNFIIIFTDDQGYEDLGCYGSPLIKTPNIDKMAAEGVKFTDFYSAASVCTPSRAALMTGCYAKRVSLTHVLFPKHNKGISDYEMTIADVLKTRGYATACVGKWHLGHMKPFLPTQHGFDSYYGIPYSNDMPIVPDGPNGVPLMRDNEIIEKPVIQDTLTQRYTDEAIGFIEKNKDQPFFLYLPHTMPHLPLNVSERFLGHSDRGLYGDVIEEIDWSVGMILGTLQKLGIDENTLVIYTSDNGPWKSKGLHGGSAGPLRGSKGTAYEGGFRVPGIMRWPGRIPAGSVCEEMAATIDMMPTLAGLAGAKVPDDRIIDGKDVWPIISGQPGAKTPHEAYFYYRGHNLCAVRSGKWKLMLPGKGQKKTKASRSAPKAIVVELYDLRADIAEANNVAEGNPEVVERLMGLIEKCREDIGDAATGTEGKNVRDCGWVGEPK